MKNIVPVGNDERLIAQGKYTCYFADGMMESGVVEYWTIHEKPDQSRIIRCDRQPNRADNGMQVQGVMFNNADGQTKRMEMQVYIGEKLSSEASYDFEDETVRINRRMLVNVNTYADWIQTDMSLPAGYKVDFGRLTISRGFILRSLPSTLPTEEDVFSKERGTPVFFPHNPGGYPLLSHTKWMLAGRVVYYAITKYPDPFISYRIGERELKGEACYLMIQDERGGYGYRAVYDPHGVMLIDGMGYIYQLTEYERYAD